jgi:hypothetical protein
MAFANGYTYRRSITVAHAKVPNTDQADFPVLVSGTYSYLAHTTHGGLCTDLNGYDIAFYSDAAGTTPLYWEIESYNHETGAVVFWVRVSLATATDTVFYMFYTNAAVSTFQSTAATVWTANYVSVYHHATNAGTDSLGVNNLASTSGTPDNAAGKIGGGIYCNNESKYKAYPLSNVPSGTAARTYSKWIKLAATGQASKYMGGWGQARGPGNGESWTFYLWKTGSDWGVSVDTTNGGGASLFTQDTNWHYLVATLPAGGGNADIKFYLDGADGTTAGATGTINTSTAGGISVGDRPWVGAGANFTMDEERISSIVRTADWIATEYNSQNDPSTFYALGDQAEASGETTEITPPVGLVLISGLAPSVSITDYKFFTPPTGTVRLTGVGPTVYVGVPLDPLGRGVCFLVPRSIKSPPFAVMKMPSERKGT